MQLRPYQAEIDVETHRLWASGTKYVLNVLPTGGGKTPLASSAIAKNNGMSCFIAHRQELVTQAALTLARHEIPHQIIAPKSVVRNAIKIQMEELGRSWYRLNAANSVAGVDTLASRIDSLADWGKNITLWVGDEAHHFLKTNKWGRALKLFPNARGLGLTATACRLDGQGLGYHNDGWFQEMIVGPTGRELINMGYLTDYKIIAPKCSINPENLRFSQRTGEVVEKSLIAETRRSTIVGDVVEAYLKFAAGKRNIVFVPDKQTGQDIVDNFIKNGIPAEMVTAESSDITRARAVRKLKTGELLALVNIDLFGEGFDVPAVEVVSMARYTESFTIYSQQFGRALRILKGKSYAIIIDHVNNIRHGLPDAARPWSLERREKRNMGPSDAIPLRACSECLAAYERVHKACPYCGHAPTPSSRSAPEFVDGDLEELDSVVLALLRGELDKIDMSVEDYRAELMRKHAPMAGVYAHTKRHAERQVAQNELREMIAIWAGHQRAYGRPDSESYRRFYFKFGTDVLTAQTLGVKDARQLREKIKNDIQKR